MKLKILCFSLQLIFFLSLCNITWAQGDKNSLIFSGTLAHYIRSGEKSDIKGFYNYPVSPGVEVLYQYKFSKFSYLSSGVNYQRGRFANYMEAHDRFRFGEISVPIIFKQVLMQKDKKNLFATAGFSYGTMVQLSWESPTSSSEWVDVPREYDEHYSDKDSFADLLFSFGASFRATPKNEFSISPYFKYRLKDNWMNYFRNELHYGIKISYQLNLIKK